MGALLLMCSNYNGEGSCAYESLEWHGSHHTRAFRIIMKNEEQVQIPQENLSFAPETQTGRMLPPVILFYFHFSSNFYVLLSIYEWTMTFSNLSFHLVRQSAEIEAHTFFQWQVWWKHEEWEAIKHPLAAINFYNQWIYFMWLSPLLLQSNNHLKVKNVSHWQVTNPASIQP